MKEYFFRISAIIYVYSNANKSRKQKFQCKISYFIISQCETILNAITEPLFYTNLPFVSGKGQIPEWYHHLRAAGRHLQNI